MDYLVILLGLLVPLGVFFFTQHQVCLHCSPSTRSIDRRQLATADEENKTLKLLHRPHFEAIMSSQLLSASGNPGWSRYTRLADGKPPEASLRGTGSLLCQEPVDGDDWGLGSVVFFLRMALKTAARILFSRSATAFCAGVRVDRPRDKKATTIDEDSVAKVLSSQNRCQLRE